MRDLKGKWVLITGASSGFGKDYAHIFAKMGANLILTARRVERLESLKSEVSQQHKVDVRVIPCDLATVDGPHKLFDETEGAGIPIEVLINNAGFGIFGRFDESKWGEVQKMLQVDIVALTELTHLFLAPMKAGKFWLHYAGVFHRCVPTISNLCRLFCRKVLCSQLWRGDQRRA